MSENPTNDELLHGDEASDIRSQKHQECESELKKSDLQFKTIFDQSFQFALILDIDGVVLKMNELCREICGDLAEGVVGFPLKEAAWWRQFRDVQEKTAKAIKTALEGRVATDEVKFFDKDHNVRYGLRIFSPVKNNNDEIIMISVVGLDISERVLAEKALESERVFLTAVLDNIQDAIVISNEEGRLIRFNEAARQLHGLPEKPMLPDQWAEHYDLYQVDGKTPLPVNEIPLFKALQGEKVMDAEIIVAAKKSEPRLMVCNGQAIRDPDGKQIGAVIAMHDITERKNAENALHESEQKWRNILVNTPQIGVSLDPKGRIIFANRHFLNLTGWKTEDVIGRDWFEMFIPEQIREEIRKVFIITMSRKDALDLSNYENEIVTKSGNLVNVAWSNLVSKDIKGNVVDVTCLGIDMTERRRAEEELRQAHKMEAIGTLAGGIAHEFNNMLGIIMGNTELALDDIPEWSPAADCIQEIRTAGLRAKDVVRKLLSVARKTTISRKPLQISTIVKESLDLLRRTIPASIDIQRTIICTTEMIMGDATEISQVLMNLCTNSVHAMSEESGVLEVSLEPMKLSRQNAAHYQGLQPGDYARLSVRDNGAGIEPGIMDRIFEPYFTTKEVDEGLGMGLAVVHGIVQKHEGAIRIESVRQAGTTIEILFPLMEAQPVTINERMDMPPSGTERILFVDDEASLVKTATRMLERSGYEVVGKTSSSVALRLFKENPDRFDLVISDMAMPEMAGDRLAQELAQIRPDVKIILCTGHSDRMDESKAKALGIQAFALKPLGRQDLAETVRKVLDEAKG